MKILCALIICCLNTWYARGQNKFATCDRSWQKVGCYRDDHDRKPSRPLPEMLLNDRDRTSPFHEPGYLLNWHKWHKSLHSLACRCAEIARRKGYKAFGLQFYGECWSGPLALKNYSRDGVSEKCITSLRTPTECVQQEAQECVGLYNTNYIYRLNESPQSPDIDGNYTNWSEWSACSKSCGGGYKSRERTCSNPKPEGNGQPCDPRLGDPEETVKCNEQDCYECDKVMDVGLVVDSSISVKRSNFEKVKTFLVDLVGQMHISFRMTHVSVIRYNHVAKVMWTFNDNEAHNSQALKNAILALVYTPGGTRTDKALNKVLEQILSSARPRVPHVVLVITDGKTHIRSEKYSDVLEPFRTLGVKVIAIGVGPSVDMNELKQIAMNDSRNVIKVSEFGKLVSRIHDILKTFCATGTGK